MRAMAEQEGVRILHGMRAPAEWAVIDQGWAEATAVMEQGAVGEGVTLATAAVTAAVVPQTLLMSICLSSL